MTVSIEEHGIAVPYQLTELHWHHPWKTQNIKTSTFQRNSRRATWEVDTGEGQTTLEERTDAQGKHDSDCIVNHVGEVDFVRYIVRWYGYASNADSVKPSDPIPEYFTTRYWGWVQQEEARRHEQKHDWLQGRRFSPILGWSTLISERQELASNYPSYSTRMSRISQWEPRLQYRNVKNSSIGTVRLQYWNVNNSPIGRHSTVQECP